MASEDKVTPLSQSQTLEEMVEFWDSPSTADFAGQTHEVEIEFDASARLNRVAIEPELMHDLCEIAEQRRISVETLVNVWLRQSVDRSLKQLQPQYTNAVPA